jgi:hypothetical protein
VRVPADRRLYLIAIGAVVAGCWTSEPARPDTPIENRTQQGPAGGWHMSARGLSPIGDQSHATLEELRAQLPAMRVEVRDLGESGVVFDVFERDEKLFYVVPDDNAPTVFAVFATSPRISVEGRTWQVGQPFLDAKGIDHCECWGNNEVTTCFQIGTHLRLVFEESCEDARQSGPQVMRGHAIGRIMWKREIEAPGMLDDSPP